jgi:hypothetical protein
MGITHDNLAVQAFKKAHGRSPTRSLNNREPDEAWIEKWKADHVARLCRDNPAYAHYYAIKATWRSRRAAKLRLKAVRRAGSAH